MLRCKPTSWLLICRSLRMLPALWISGCAIHPLPENVTGLDTVAIVRKIRCEVRDSIKEQVVKLLESDNRADQEFKDKAINLIKENFPAWRDIDQSKLSDNSRKLIDRYDNAFIFMDFTFQISEDNNNNSEINLLSTLTRGTDGLNIKASNNRTRKSTRNFRVQDTFVGIFEANLTCAGRSKNPDYMYPVTGEIGVAEVIDTFLRLNETRALTTGVIKDRLFADTVSFTTTISASLGPKILLGPVGKPLSLADAAFTSTSTRTDIHDVLIGLSLPEEELKIAAAEISARGTGARPRTAIVRQSRPEQAQQLNDFMDFQLRRNLILNATTPSRPLVLSVF